MKSIKVGFDISQTAYHGGVGIYTQNLALYLSKMTDIKITYFYSSLRKPYQGSLANVKSYRLPQTAVEILFNQLRKINIEKFIGNIDVFHSSDWTQPPAIAKKVTTYHDLVALKYPQWSHPKIVKVHQRRLKLVENEIDMVIAVSEVTKKDLMEVSSIPEEKITVIYEGPSIEYKKRSPEEIQEFKTKYNLPEKFILAIGGIGERRNLARVKEVCKDDNLVIAGKTLPWLREEELGLLYTAADLLLYPSLYEGFGLPILDAQLCGCPVVTSNVSSMPEVAGKGAVLVNPNSVEDIARGIKKARENREELIKKGFDNVKKFSWKRCAEETATVYRRLVK